MQAVLSRNPRVRIATEFWPIGLQRFGTTAERYLEQLKQLGFRLWNIDKYSGTLKEVSAHELLARYRPENEDDATNLLCVRAGDGPDALARG